MDKVAFFYNLGYQLVKEADIEDMYRRDVAEKLWEERMRKRKKSHRSTRGSRSALDKILSGIKRTGGETVDIWKALFGIGKPSRMKYLKNLAKVWGRAGIPARISAGAIPAAALGGAGYGAYRATHKKSKLEELLGL